MKTGFVVCRRIEKEWQFCLFEWFCRTLHLVKMGIKPNIESFKAWWARMSELKKNPWLCLYQCMSIIYAITAAIAFMVVTALNVACQQVMYASLSSAWFIIFLTYGVWVTAPCSVPCATCCGVLVTWLATTWEVIIWTISHRSRCWRCSPFSFSSWLGLLI